MVTSFYSTGFFTLFCFGKTTLQSIMNALYQTAMVLALSREQAQLEDSNDTPQPLFAFQVVFLLLWNWAKPGFP